MRILLLVLSIFISLGECKASYRGGGVESEGEEEILRAHMHFRDGERSPLVRSLETASQLCFSLGGHRDDYLVCDDVNGRNVHVTSSLPREVIWCDHSSKPVSKELQRRFSEIIDAVRSADSRSELMMRDFIISAYSPDFRLTSEYQERFVHRAPASVEWEEYKVPLMVGGMVVMGAMAAGLWWCNTHHCRW